MFLLFSAGTYVMYRDKYSLRPQTLRAIQVFDSSLPQDSSASSKYSGPFHWKSILLLFIASSQSGRFVILWLYKFLRWFSEVTIWKTRRHAFVHFPVVWWSFVYTQDQKWVLRLFIHPSRACVGSSLINLQKRNIYLAFAVFLYANLS